MLMLGAVALEVIEAVKDLPVGICASEAQVGEFEPGYSGMNYVDLRRRLPHHYLRRDHCKTDFHSPWNSVMWDQDIKPKKAMMYEVGCGEDKNKNFADRLSNVSREWITSVSAWAGTKMFCGNNSISWVPMENNAATLLAVCPDVVAHNCDFLSRSHITAMKSAGWTSFNFAPQLGYEVTMAYMRRADCRNWLRLVEADGRWAKWGPSPEYGGHYLLTSLGGVRLKHFQEIVRHVRSFIQELLSWMQ